MMGPRKGDAMARVERRKCKCCLKLFCPDPRNRRHQCYCSAATSHLEGSTRYGSPDLRYIPQDSALPTSKNDVTAQGYLQSQASTHFAQALGLVEADLAGT
jgi:hypothetical protein